ncbi:hypothetical protein IFO69_11005 [Echinicola sp. CAU 1574]|uniref:Uncharacterized protein n=1 Tax=Echinicola arenosa TaxID=2774144 RepID=A0ABR9ANS7_9BACT|nr:hypothetical protein [Echinicola arenosa]MBD8489274.1 hypothetical protein [Echinicola arenosa]
MNVSSIYKTLATVSIYHNYFLDNGETSFASMNTDEQAEQLKYFDFRSFLKITPTQETLKVMSGQKIIFKLYPNSILLAIKVGATDESIPFIPLEDSLKLNFNLYIVDSYFENYTALELDTSKLMFFSNESPIFPDPASFESIPRFNQNKLIDGDYLYEGKNKDFLLANFADNPLLLSGILSIQIKSSNTADSLINNDGSLKNTPPHFKIQFDNQKTIWKYIHRKDEFEVETKQAMPLTKYGYIKLENPTDFKSSPPSPDKYQFPNPSANSVKLISNQLYSEIFI